MSHFAIHAHSLFIFLKHLIRDMHKNQRCKENKLALVSIFATSPSEICRKKQYFDMNVTRIQSPDEVVNLMKVLWHNHQAGLNSTAGRVFMVDLPKPTEEENRIMAANRANRKLMFIDENELNNTLMNAVGELGGW